jgi:signal transduction histidine kinase
MAHEVNNHLAAALMDLELAIDGDLTPATRDLLQRLHVAVESAGEVCRGTLGLLRPEPASAPPGVVGEAIRRSIACLGRLRSRVVVNADTPAAGASTPLPLVQLQQVILNGLLNALRATDGAVRLEVLLVSTSDEPRSARGRTGAATGSTWNASAKQSSAPRQSVLIAIHDDGPGMPEALRHQLETPSTPGSIARVGNAGLGLSVMKHMVATAGGTLRARKVLPTGTRVEIVVPALDVQGTRRAA